MANERDDRGGGYRGDRGYRGGGYRGERGSHRAEGGDYGSFGYDRERMERAGDAYQLQSYGGGEHGAYPRGGGREDEGRRGPPDQAYGQTNQYSQSRDRDRFERDGAAPSAFGGSGGGYGSGARADDRGHPYDPHYSNWRDRQMSDLDRDYHEFRQEHQRRFEEEFHGWRSRRQDQREMVRSVREGMAVVGSDGQRIGAVDKVEGDRIKLKRNDPQSGGHHHSFPSSWIERVEDGVVVNRTAEQAMREWMDEERDRALNERGGAAGSAGGPHYLDRAFGGTYNR